MSYYGRKANMLMDVVGNIVNYEGYKVLYDPTNIHQFPYVYVITPRDNVLCISAGGSNIVGLSATLEYMPSKTNGRGCACCDEPFFDITLESLEKLEQSGLNFAKRLGTKLYANSEVWLQDCFAKDKLVDLKEHEYQAENEEYER